MFDSRSTAALPGALWALASLLSVAVPAQDTGRTEIAPADVAAATLHWVHAFDAGDIRLGARVRIARSSVRDWVRLGVRSGVLTAGEDATPMSVLHKLVEAAERHPGVETARALLALAAAGFATDVFGHRTVMVRELGHFALRRMDAPAVWSHVESVAVGPEPSGEGDDVRVEPPAPRRRDRDLPAFDEDARAMWRVAAIQLLGKEDAERYRPSIEKCAGDADGRVRLAAAEALGALHAAESLPVVVDALRDESHPMASLAFVQAVHRILNAHAATAIDAAGSGLALSTALARLGEVDWRSDMAIVRLLADHPVKAGVQPMIALMRNARGESDPILKIINASASRLLAAEAHRALRRITGAAWEGDPDVWQEFWDAERDRIVVRRPRPRPAGGTSATRVTRTASFYGIPVLGSDVVFVLDTSGSMKKRIVSAYRGPTTGPRKPKKRELRGTRLQVARYQTARAIQSMPEGSKFSIVSFADAARAWNRKPVTARRSSRGAAARILGRLRPRGGTNVFDALVHVLDAKRVGYGEPTESGVDEIFVLSDGQPTTGELTSPDRILEVVREVNRLRRARINTVFAGRADEPGADFMRRLAEENGGVFVQQ